MKFDNVEASVIDAAKRRLSCVMSGCLKLCFLVRIAHQPDDQQTNERPSMRSFQASPRNNAQVVTIGPLLPP